MTTHFPDLGSLATYIALRATAIEASLSQGLEQVGEMIAEDARDKIGTYQAASGPFIAWAPLAASTVERKGHNLPLYETGELQDSFDFDVVGLEMAAGSKDPKMVFHERGTERMPARPVVGPAGFENREAIRMLIAASLASGLVSAADAREIARQSGGLFGGAGYRIR